MLHQAKLLLDRADALHLAGQWQTAIELCEEAFRKSLEDRNLDAVMESILRIGLAYRQTEHTDLAFEYHDLALTIAQLKEDQGWEGRALNALAILHQDHGEVKAAEDAYHRARELCLSVPDLLSAGRIDQNLGALANLRGNLSEALAHYQSSLALYEQVDYERGVSGVLNNLGMLYIDLHELDEARSCLDRALEICKRNNDIVSEGIVYINRTELFLELGEPLRARASCDEAYEISSGLKDDRSKADILKFYGTIFREIGKPHLAESHFRQSIVLTSQYTNPLIEAEAQRELALVLRQQERNREALEALNRSHALFSSLQAKQDQADVTKRLSQLEEEFLSLVQMWGESIEAKDRYTSGHCQRVSDYACRIAEVVGIPERDITWFRMGAFLHDLGKTEVPEEILNKPGPLTDEERKIMEQHTVIGDEILAPIAFPWDIRPMIRSHHERWDGNGYPDGLSAEAIPYTARILRIADIFDALTTSRSYRQPLSAEAAFQLMENDHGSFDPELFELFRSLFCEFACSIPGGEVGNADVSFSKTT